MKCDICGELMNQDETGLFDVVDAIGGHISCMRTYYEEKHGG